MRLKVACVSHTLGGCERVVLASRATTLLSLSLSKIKIMKSRSFWCFAAFALQPAIVVADAPEVDLAFLALIETCEHAREYLHLQTLARHAVLGSL